MKEVDFKECNFFDWQLNKFVYEQPNHFVLKGKKYSVDTWVDLIDTLCLILEEENQGLMERFLDDEKHARTRIPYISKSKDDIHFKKFLPKSCLWLNYKIDSPRSVKMLRWLLEKYKIDERHFKLYLQNKE